LALIIQHMQCSRIDLGSNSKGKVSIRQNGSRGTAPACFPLEEGGRVHERPVLRLNTTSRHWEAVASPKSIEIHQYPSISASKSHSMRSIVAFHQHVVVQHVAALQHGCTATIRKTLQSNHIQFHSLCMDQHSLGART
jgi:hypothetical protein